MQVYKLQLRSLQDLLSKTFYNHVLATQLRSRQVVVSHDAKKKQHACVYWGLRDHYSELFTQMVTLNFRMLQFNRYYSCHLVYYRPSTSCWVELTAEGGLIKSLLYIPFLRTSQFMSFGAHFRGYTVKDEVSTHTIDVIYDTVKVAITPK